MNSLQGKAEAEMLEVINYWDVGAWKGHVDNISCLGRETGPGLHGSHEQYMEFSL